MSLTKADIIDAIHQELQFTKSKSTEAVEQVLEIIKSTLASGEDVLISGFGKFCVKEKAERKGRNPATGEDMMLLPRKVVTFRVSGRLRDRVNDAEQDMNDEQIGLTGKKIVKSTVFYCDKDENPVRSKKDATFVSIREEYEDGTFEEVLGTFSDDDD